MTSPQFQAEFKRFYATKEETEYRRAVFEQNMAVAATMQALNPLAEFGPTAFADMTAEEFKAYHNADAYFAREMERARVDGGPSHLRLETRLTGARRER